MRRLVCLLLLSAAGCGGAPSYVPVQQVTATLSGFPAARYGVPPEAPSGRITVATFGVARVEVRERQPVDALHVRLSIEGGGEGPLQLDTRAVLLEIAGNSPIRPAFVNASATDLPILRIPSGERRIVDLYYALPPDLRRASDIPSFELAWRVETPRREIAQRSTFDRMRLDPTTAPDTGWGLGEGGYWWYDPLGYPGPIITTPVFVARVRPRGLVGQMR